MPKLKLLSTNQKLEKHIPGFLAYGLQLAPTNISGFNVCQFASEGCRAACLFSAGKGALPHVIKGRIRKTRLFFEDKKEFENQIVRDIEKVLETAKSENKRAAIRLNTISDLPWESIRFGAASLIDLFPDVQFYDYTKSVRRALNFSRGRRGNLPWPKNYHLTFSRSESNEKQVKKVIDAGGNVAVVFGVRKLDKLPGKYYDRRVVDGDINDGRFLDPDGCVVGLRGKGKAKKDKTGFIL